MDADTLAEIKWRSAQAAHDATQGYDLPGWADVDALVAEVERLRAALDEIDHHTYGWSFDTAVPMVDRIRLTARAALAGNQ
jgi:hypothetical protein